MGLNLYSLIDQDIFEATRQCDANTMILWQILRELKKEGPEEKTTPVKGFSAEEHNG